MARIILTNDDGIHSLGLHALALALTKEGHDVTVAAPSSERSGWGAGVGTLDNGAEFEIQPYSIPNAPHVDAWGIDGPPAFCVLTAMLGTFGEPPELVISGSNDGANCGRGILHSGTIGAAMIAQNFGISGIAISQKRSGSRMLWETSGIIAAAATHWIMQAPRKTVLNINVPNKPIKQIRGVKWGRIAAFGTTKTSLEGNIPGKLKIVVSPRDVELKPDTDTALVDEGFISVTGLTGYRALVDASHEAPEAIEAFLRSTGGIGENP
ncbi:MAG: 5'/3'-nucleotidase SurE [Acidimicrobiales bacterium]|jgi:5'-nucleotidase|nr:5'/3'-nucleotidase SurE [Acidimicrobiales bacterium]MDP6298220.1 5'/3'-nucleotidase SurE [Acidimicrobiales bacterium]HJM29056.1 5'/3'-nucleotidase SurE [Acidimicrobiales bacterium]HJM97141.1 5'/3'-nucleotidase SurE [Acidimicrobiales bacterium]